MRRRDQGGARRIAWAVARVALLLFAVVMVIAVPVSNASAAGVAEEGCVAPDVQCEMATTEASDGGAVGFVRDVSSLAVGATLEAIPNPFAELGDRVASAAADAWTAAMLAVWSAGLYVLKLVLGFADYFLTPDLSADGPGRRVYEYTFWIAAALVVVMSMVQLGVAAIRRDGKSLARVAIGGAQFVVVWAAWLGYCVAVVTACSGLTRALLEALLEVDSWQDWDPLGGMDASKVTDGVVATVLGLLGLVLWLAALGHLLVMLARAASLIVLVATGPIAAAGLVADAGTSWFWKSLRWFHAAAFTPVVMVLVLGLGVQVATGVADGLSDSTAKAVGTALPAVMLICVAAVAPMALFKLLAFVDPGTPSGASFRQGMAMQGGVEGLLSGRATGGSGASETDAHGRSAGESGAESASNARFAQATQAALGGGGGGASAGAGTAGGMAGIGAVAGGLGAGLGVVAAGIGLMQKVGSEATGLLSDQTNQAGVGHHTYGPDFSGLRQPRGPATTGESGATGSDYGRFPRYPDDDHLGLTGVGHPPGPGPGAAAWDAVEDQAAAG